VITVSLYEPDVDAQLADGWTGLALFRSATQGGAYTQIASIPYVAGQEVYSWGDSTAAGTDWYKTARYQGLTLSDYSNPFPARTGTTMAAIRQAAVRMVNGRDALVLTAATGGSQNYIEDTTNSLRSSISRGKILDSAWIYRPAAALDADKVRMVAEGGYDHAAGRLTPDLEWTNAPVPGETFEVILGANLHPLDSIAPAIRDGLARCRFVDTVLVINDTPGQDTNLSAFYPWLTSPVQLRTLAPATSDGHYAEHHHVHFRPYMKRGELWIRTEEAYSYLNLEVLRPHSTYVNDQDSIGGPVYDSDVVRCPLDWAVAATVVEIYKGFGTGLAAKENALVETALGRWSAEFSRLSGTYLRQAVQPKPAISMPRIGVGRRDFY